MVEAERAENLWISSEMPSSSPAATDGREFSTIDSITGISDVRGFGSLAPQIASRPPLEKGSSEDNLGLTERVFSAAGAAFLSAVIVNPLDVVKVGFFLLSGWLIPKDGKLYVYRRWT